MAKQKVRVSFTPVVWIEIWGQETSAHGFYDDGGLCGELMKWMMEEKIYSAKGGRTGGGGLSQGYRATDAERIKEWLRRKGIRFK